MDHSDALLNNKCFFVATDDTFLLALLNSRCFWLQLASVARVKRGGYIEAEAQYVEILPIPVPASRTRTAVAKLSNQCTIASMRRLEIQSTVRHRILDLATSKRRRLSGKLENWWILDFPAFRAEVRHALRADIPVKERDQWEAYLRTNASQWHRLSHQIDAAERQIDMMVYHLFDLNADEIRLLGNSLSARG